MSYDLQLRSCAKRLRNAPTPEEKKLWKYLRRNNISGVKFRRQHIINGYIVDFYAPEIKLVVELDGGNHRKTKEYDKLRTAVLFERGCKVLRFWNREVVKDIRRVLARIEKNVEERLKVSRGAKDVVLR